MYLEKLTKIGLFTFLHKSGESYKPPKMNGFWNWI